MDRGEQQMYNDQYLTIRRRYQTVSEEDRLLRQEIRGMDKTNDVWDELQLELHDIQSELNLLHLDYTRFKEEVLERNRSKHTKRPGHFDTSKQRSEESTLFKRPRYMTRSHSKALKHIEDEKAEVQEASMNTTIAKLPRQESIKAACMVCDDSLPILDIITLDCDHKWCKDCLKGSYSRATKMEESYPPKCCNRIPYQLVRPNLTYEEASAYRLARVEYRTASRFYCGNMKCREFIHPRKLTENGVGLVSCRKCPELTCQKCKKVHETIIECEEHEMDNDSKALLLLAEKNGWKQCTRCARLVGKRHGCNHINCQCGQIFCYQCGKAVKACRCVWGEMEQELDDNIALNDEERIL